jgi:hypothetical protein
MRVAQDRNSGSDGNRTVVDQPITTYEKWCDVTTEFYCDRPMSSKVTGA